jgi:outer membrane protein assembly factor BamB
MGLAALCCIAVGGQADSWPQFRGPAGSGIGARGFPVHFGPTTNRLWDVPVPTGHSSVSVVGSRLFTTGYESNRLAVFALDRETGRRLWTRSLVPGAIERGAGLSQPATATPASDGERIVVYFGSFGLACFDLEGREQWTRPLPVPVTQHGAGTSPVIAGDLAVLNCDQDVGSYLLAVDKRTGATRWRADRAEFHRGFSTPLPYPPEHPEQLIVPGSLRLVSYNLADGTERWWVRGFPNEMVSSPVAGGGVVYVAGWTYGSGVARMPPFETLLAQADADHDGQLTREEAPSGPAKQHFVYLDADKDGRVTRAEYDAVARLFDESRNVCLAVRPDGRGDVTETHVLWRAAKGLPYVPTPLLYEGRLHLLKNGGMFSAYDARTGRVLYQEERLGALGDNYASPIAGEGRICVISQQGTAVVLRASDTLEVLARNPLGEPVIATPALADGCLYVRTLTRLYAFREGAAGTNAP